MKKLTLMLLAFLPLTACETEDVKPIEYSQLPAKAQEFINAHFSDRTISTVFVDKDLFDTDYEVIFTDGTDIDFDKDGDWTSVDMKNGEAVPTSAIPSGINSYVSSKHSNAYVVDMDQERREYKVELNNQIEIVFDKSGNFKRYDD